MNKRGAEFTITTLVVIVLAILVLVVLALGFGAGWSNLWSKITGYFSPVNVDAVKQACQFACTTEARYDYCCRIREVKLEKGKEPTLSTCSTNPVIKPEDCSLDCNGACSKDLICEKNNLKPIPSGEKPENVCGSVDLVDNTKKLKEDLYPINPKEEVCCLTNPPRT